MEHDRGIKLKTSITLEEDVVTAVSSVARTGESRSQTIERLLPQSLLTVT